VVRPQPYVRKRAEQVAALGYVAFALDMYGKGVLAKDAQEAAKMAGRLQGRPGANAGSARPTPACKC